MHVFGVDPTFTGKYIQSRWYIIHVPGNACWDSPEVWLISILIVISPKRCLVDSVSSTSITDRGRSATILLSKLSFPRWTRIAAETQATGFDMLQAWNKVSWSWPSVAIQCEEISSSSRIPIDMDGLPKVARAASDEAQLSSWCLMISRRSSKASIVAVSSIEWNIVYPIH